MKEKYINILNAYLFSGDFVKIELFKKGNINDTFKLDYTHASYFLQKINTNIFKDPVKLSENIENVLSFIKNKIKNTELQNQNFLQILKTRDNKSYFRSSEGDYWRAFLWIEDAISYAYPQSTFQAIQAGKALAEFQYLLQDYPAETLHETIPNFHNTKWRYQQFLRILEKDAFGRAALVQQQSQFFLDRSHLMPMIVDLLENKGLPMRVTHNDPKLDNILLDVETEEAICLIDFDTIMPGTLLYDFGDLIRTCATNAAETETDLSKVGINLELFEACVKGYAPTAKKFITPREKETLYYGILIITLEQALRFFTDYLDGDTYYKIAHPKQNLERALNQIELVKSIELNQDQLVAIIDQYFK